MCRLAGWVCDEPRTMREMLGDGGVERLRLLSTVHCHGWGMAWHDDAGVLQLVRSPRPAHEDPDFAAAVDGLRARDAIVHLRMGTPGYGRTVVDNHPFGDGEWALIHNGAVAPTALVDRLLPEGVMPDGSTDSERWFLALRARLRAGHPIGRAVSDVIDHALATQLHASSWNSLLLGPDALHVVNHHDLSWVPVDVRLWPELYPDEAIGWPPYFDLRMRRADGVTAVVSSGIVDDVAGWELLANGTVLSVPFAGSAVSREAMRTAVPASSSGAAPTC